MIDHLHLIKNVLYILIKVLHCIMFYHMIFKTWYYQDIFYLCSVLFYYIDLNRFTLQAIKIKSYLLAI